MWTAQRCLDRAVDSWRSAASTCRAAEPSSTAPIAAVSPVHVAVMVLAVQMLSFARLVQHQRAASQG